ncbi:MAG: hypothetical protein JF603_04585 [Acidobacteria bacterium]|nr:hypothetical protein [Acidobacteriota bacterium]
MHARRSVALVGGLTVVAALLATGHAGAQTPPTVTITTVTLPPITSTTTSTTAPGSTSTTSSSTTTSTTPKATTTTTAAPAGTTTTTPAAGTTRTTTAPPHATPTTTRRWQASAGKYRTRSSARARLRQVTAKGLNGYVIERERGPRFDVERTFPTRAAATAEVARLRRTHFSGHVEAA